MIGRVLHSPLVTGDNAGRTPCSRPKGALQFAAQWRRFQPGSARTKSSRVSAPVEWARSIRRPTRAWAGRLRSKYFRLMLPAIPRFAHASSARRKRFRVSTTPTSVRCTTSGTRRGLTSWSWNTWKERRFRTDWREVRCRLRGAADWHRDRRRARQGASPRHYPGGAPYDVARDGRFLVNELVALTPAAGSAADTSSFTVVLNFLSALSAAGSQ